MANIISRLISFFNRSTHQRNGDGLSHAGSNRSVSKGLWIMALCLMTVSCGTVEEYVLLNDLDVDVRYPMQARHELRIKRGDELQIVVTHKLPSLTEQFNRKINSLEEGEELTTYSVDNHGCINFPYLDSVKVEGMTCSELEQYLSKRIADDGIAYGAMVNVKITNFSVTVIGETGTGVYEFEDGDVTIFDLVAKANLANSGGGGYGGMGIRRDKILIMREINGVLNSDYVSLLTKDIFYSPYYYLQQKDIIYVWPSQESIRNSNRIVDFWLGRLSIVTTAVSVVTLIVSIFVKNKE